MRLVEYLAEQRISFQMLLHPPAFSAQRRAKYLHVKGEQVAKAVLLHGPDGRFLAVLPATHEVDLRWLSSFLGGSVAVVSQTEAARVFRDCEWGVVSAFGNLYGLPTLVDSALRPDSWIILEAATHVEAILLSCRDYERLSGSFRLSFARRCG
jgi:Ala-tRNA(Pro) deacylase